MPERYEADVTALLWSSDALKASAKRQIFFLTRPDSRSENGEYDIEKRHQDSLGAVSKACYVNLDMSQLVHLEQKPQNGASKSQLLSEIDKKVEMMD